jgi:hypothetical protein
MKRLTARVLALIVGLSLLTAWGWFVWPTPYRYVTSAHVYTAPATVRIHRITGDVDVLSLSGWKRLEPGPRNPNSRVP